MMGKDERLDLIKTIEEHTNSRVMVYFTGDRRSFETKIGNDVIPLFYEHLDAIGHQKKITLMLYTLGGITNAGFGLVSLIREYCDEFDVIVPFKCLSTGTLMVLGANRIFMSKVGQLSPIDPSTFHNLGPREQLPGMLPQSIPINVEDVMGYFELARDDAKIDPNNMTEVFKILASKIHPVTLGAIKRAENQVAYMASTLLRFHSTRKQRNAKIVNELLKERFSHQYLITRREAEGLGLPIGDISPIEEAVMTLYREYASFLDLGSDFLPEQILGGSDQKSVDVNQAVVESTQMSHTYRTVLELFVTSQDDTQRHPSPHDGHPDPHIMRQIQQNVRSVGWIKN